MTCAIVDTAHITTTHSLSVGDLDLARFAAETAADSAPYEETRSWISWPWRRLRVRMFEPAAD